MPYLLVGDVLPRADDTGPPLVWMLGGETVTYRRADTVMGYLVIAFFAVLYVLSFFSPQ